MQRTVLVLIMTASGLLCGCVPEPAPTPEAVEAEARALFAAWGEAIKVGDGPGILDVYSRNGLRLVSKGRVDQLGFGDLEVAYLSDEVGPQDFTWEDLSFDVLSPDAVVATATMVLKWHDDEGVRGSEMVLLVREEGGLRIRVESESLTNLEPFAWCGEADLCARPLGPAERSRYVGEYHLGDLAARVFEEDGQLMIDGPFETPRNRLLYYGDQQFRLDSVPDLRLVFAGDSIRMNRFTNFRDVFFGTFNRISAQR